MGLKTLTAAEYEINSSGIYIPDNSTKISSAGTPVSVGYTTTTGSTIEALVSAGAEYHVIFSGTNMARDGKAVTVDLYRIKFGPPKDLAFISDDFASMVLTATVLKDDTKTGANISAFCAIKMVEE